MPEIPLRSKITLKRFWIRAGANLRDLSGQMQHHPTCETDVFTWCLLLVAQRCSGPWAEHTTEDILFSWWLLMPHYRHTLKLHNVISREFSLSAAECTIIVLTAKNWAADTSLCWLLCCITWVYFLSIGVYECGNSPCIHICILLHTCKRRMGCIDYTLGEQNPDDVLHLLGFWSEETMDPLLSR